MAINQSNKILRPFTISFFCVCELYKVAYSLTVFGIFISDTSSVSNIHLIGVSSRHIWFWWGL